MARANQNLVTAPVVEEATAEAVAASTTEARWYVSDRACTLTDGRFVPAGAPFQTDAPASKYWKDWETPSLEA